MTNQIESIDSLHHIALSVRDKSIAEVVDWYREQFRCEVVYQDQTWAMLQFANIRLALVTPGQHPPHLGFESSRAEEYGELKTHRDGTRSVYVADPANNAIEILEPIEKDS